MAVRLLGLASSSAPSSPRCSSAASSTTPRSTTSPTAVRPPSGRRRRCGEAFAVRDRHDVLPRLRRLRDRRRRARRVQDRGRLRHRPEITLAVLVGGPLSGAAMNPARAFGPQLVGNLGRRLDLLHRPPVGGALAAVVYVRLYLDRPSRDRRAAGRAPTSTSAGVERRRARRPERAGSDRRLAAARGPRRARPRGSRASGRPRRAPRHTAAGRCTSRPSRARRRRRSRSRRGRRARAAAARGRARRSRPTRRPGPTTSTRPTRPARRRSDELDRVVRAVERGADQVVHAAVADGDRGRPGTSFT